MTTPTQPNATNLASGSNYVGPTPNVTANDIPCPVSTPYFNGTNCTSCVSPTPLFNTTSKQCTACPNGTVYNSTNHSCTPVTVPPVTPNATNTNATNFVGTAPTNNTSDVPCPMTAPFFNGTGCVNCTNPTPIFNTTSLQCTACPNGTVYNSTTHSCTPVTVPPVTPNATNTNATNFVGTAPTNNTSDVPCPMTAPFFNGTGCVNCTDPTPIFNTSTLACTACPNGTVYNSTTHSCTPVTVPPVTPNATNPLAQNGTIGIVPNTTTPCPVDTPFYNGTACISCPPLTPYFNLTSKTCVPCTNYDVVNHTCPQLTPNASNIVGTNSTIGNLTTAGPNDIPCPEATPFFINGNCTACVDPNPYFYPPLNDCVGCPVGSTYDPVNHGCVAGLPYTSNLSATNNWVSASPFRDSV